MLQTNCALTEPVWIERRSSMRFPANDEAEIEIAGDPTVKLSGFLRDVSRNGIRLVLPERVPPGAQVKIILRGSPVLFGEIRYCRCAGAIYYAGVFFGTPKEIGAPLQSVVQ